MGGGLEMKLGREKNEMGRRREGMMRRREYWKRKEGGQGQEGD